MVRETLKRFAGSGLIWPLGDDMTDSILKACMYKNAKKKQKNRRRAAPLCEGEGGGAPDCDVDMGFDHIEDSIGQSKSDADLWIGAKKIMNDGYYMLLANQER